MRRGDADRPSLIRKDQTSLAPLRFPLRRVYYSSTGSNRGGPLLPRCSVASTLALLAALFLALVAVSSAEATTATFTNVASSAGVENLAGVGDPLNPIRQEDWKGAFTDYVATMHMWGGVAINDFNGDGYPDIYVTNDGANALYRNNGNWTFTEVAAAAGVATGGRSMGAAWGDYNNDGCRDLFVSNFRGPSTLYRSNCDGTFSNVTVAANISVTMRAAGVAWGDYDRDGWLDLVIGCYTACPNVLLHNQGDGTFVDATAAAGVADRGWTFQPVWIDYDQDGDLDLMDVNDFGPDRLYRNNDNGTFTEVSAAWRRPRGRGWDGDGHRRHRQRRMARLLRDQLLQ